MPQRLERPVADAARRHEARYSNPGLAVEVEHLNEAVYRIVAPHADHDAWMTMVCDAIGTASESTAITFLNSLAEVCRKNYISTGQVDQFDRPISVWAPDETELNMILNMVGSLKPKSEIEAALAAQMVAVHLMTMRAASEALGGWTMDFRTAAITGKLARTFAMQVDTLGRLRGKRKSTRQSIHVTHEKHVHHHQHVHLDGGGINEFGDQAHGKTGPGAHEIGDAPVPSLPRENAEGIVMPVPSGQGKKQMSHTRRGKGIGSAEG